MGIAQAQSRRTRFLQWGVVLRKVLVPISIVDSLILVGQCKGRAARLSTSVVFSLPFPVKCDDSWTIVLALESVPVVGTFQNAPQRYTVPFLKEKDPVHFSNRWKKYTHRSR